MGYLLDTDTWSYFLRGERGVGERVRTVLDESLHLCRVTLAELEAWAHHRRSTRRLSQIRKLARRVQFVEVGVATWDLFPRAHGELLRRGSKIGGLDILIGCCAAVHGLTIVSNNTKHLRPICDVLDVALENWAKPDRSRRS